jgi:hypothetical protein
MLGHEEVHVLTQPKQRSTSGTSGVSPIGPLRSVHLSLGAAPPAASPGSAVTTSPSSSDAGHLTASAQPAAANDAPLTGVHGAPGQAVLEDRGVRGAFLSYRADDGATQQRIELPLAFANIDCEGATLTVTVHKDVHPDC